MQKDINLAFMTAALKAVKNHKTREALIFAFNDVLNEQTAVNEDALVAGMMRDAVQNAVDHKWIDENYWMRDGVFMMLLEQQRDNLASTLAIAHAIAKHGGKAARSHPNIKVRQQIPYLLVELAFKVDVPSIDTSILKTANKIIKESDPEIRSNGLWLINIVGCRRPASLTKQAVANVAEYMDAKTFYDGYCEELAGIIVNRRPELMSGKFIESLCLVAEKDASARALLKTAQCRRPTLPGYRYIQPFTAQQAATP